MEGDPLLVHSKQQFVAKSENLVVPADSSKLTSRKSIIMSSLKKVDVVITDTEIDTESQEMLHHAGVKLVIADC